MLQLKTAGETRLSDSACPCRACYAAHGHITIRQRASPCNVTGPVPHRSLTLTCLERDSTLHTAASDQLLPTFILTEYAQVPAKARGSRRPLAPVDS